MLEIKNLSSGYGKKKVINNLSLNVEKGELVVVAGPNGCGKSTLLKTIVGIISAYDGEVFLDGKNIAHTERKKLAQKIAYLSQSRTVPDMTVSQMVLHGRFPHLGYPRRYSHKDKEIAVSAMKKMNVDRLSGEKVITLSGGMRQKVFIAMALCQNTDYILLDEPTSNLDAAGSYELMELLKKLTEEGKTIITVMHDLPLSFSFSDKIALMKEGELCFYGTAEKALETDVVKTVFGIKIEKTTDGKSYYYSKL